MLARQHVDVRVVHQGVDEGGDDFVAGLIELAAPAHALETLGDRLLLHEGERHHLAQVADFVAKGGDVGGGYRGRGRGHLAPDLDADDNEDRGGRGLQKRAHCPMAPHPAARPPARRGQTVARFMRPRDRERGMRASAAPPGAFARNAGRCIARPSSRRSARASRLGIGLQPARMRPSRCHISTAPSSSSRQAGHEAAWLSSACRSASGSVPAR